MTTRSPDADSPDEDPLSFGSADLDKMIRGAVEACRTWLPPDRRTLDEAEKDVRRRFDRIFRDLREDERRKKVSGTFFRKGS